MQYHQYPSTQPISMTMPFFGREELCIGYEDGAEYVHKLTQPFVTIGRDGNHAIVLADPEISRDHLRLAWNNGSWYVTDLGSTNGTILNNTQLPAHIPFRLLLDSELEIGSYRLILRSNTARSADKATHYRLNGGTRIKRITPSYEANLTPDLLNSDGQFFLTLTNTSTETQLYDVKIEADYSLGIVPTRWKAEIPAHQKDQLAIQIETPKQPIWGKTLSYSVAIQIDTANAPTRFLEGEVTIRPIFDLERLKKLLAVLSNLPKATRGSL